MVAIYVYSFIIFIVIWRGWSFPRMVGVVMIFISCRFSWSILTIGRDWIYQRAIGQIPIFLQMFSSILHFYVGGSENILMLITIVIIFINQWWAWSSRSVIIIWLNSGSIFIHMINSSRIIRRWQNFSTRRRWAILRGNVGVTFFFQRIFSSNIFTVRRGWIISRGIFAVAAFIFR